MLSNDYQITISGVIIHPDDVEFLGNITKTADFPNLGEFRLGKFSFTLFDLDGSFSPTNENNFFVANGGLQNGVGAEVEFAVSRGGEMKTLFSGKILSLNPLPITASVEIIAGDVSLEIGSNNVENFGRDVRFKLVEETEAQRQRALGQRQPRANEVYPLLPALLPRSKGSATLYALSLSDTHEEVESLRRSGNLDYQRFIMTDSAVQTEGGRVPVTTQQATFPQIAYKAVHKHTHLMKLIGDLLTHYDIEDREITIPTPTLPEHFSSNGRPDALLGSDQFDLTSTWRTFITDFTYNAADTSYYFLMSIKLDDGLNRSELIKYNITDYSWESVHRFEANIKVWRMAFASGKIYFMTTNQQAPHSLNVFADTYNMQVSEFDLTQRILRYDRTVFGSDITPYLNSYYHLGNNPHDVLYNGILQESRKSFLVHDDNLYFPYIQVPNHFGVATTNNVLQDARAVCTFLSDGHENWANCSFDIRGDTLYVCATHRNGENSERNIWSVDISGL